MGVLLVTVISGYVAFNAIKMGLAHEQGKNLPASGLPLEWTFYPMARLARLFMTVFAAELFLRPACPRHGNRNSCDKRDRRPVFWLGISLGARFRCRRRGTLMLVGFLHHPVWRIAESVSAAGRWRR